MVSLKPQDGAKEALLPNNNGSSPPQPVPMFYKGPPQPRSSPSRPTTNSSNAASKPPPPKSSSNNNGARSSNNDARKPTSQRTPAAGMNLGGTKMPAGAPGFSRSMMVAGFDDDATSASDLAMDYNYTWSKDDYSTLERTFDTWSFVLTLRARLWLLDQKWSYPGGETPEKRGARARTLAIWIRERILQLGPTFIKLGQLFSTRSDLFPAEFVEELSKLQDRVPAFSSDKAIAIIEKELGAPINQLFTEFNSRPIAAASLGQVHVARLPTGEQVVVKVQRPGLKRLFDIDLENLRVVAEQFDKGDDGQGIRDFTGIYKECSQILYEEIDYINEGRNADRFRRNFRDVDWVQVPRVHWQRTSASVMTMEYLPGPKITDIAAIQAFGLDPKLVAKRATEAYLLQILTHGFFHSDPHPGNLAISPTGGLIFYDFGMMGSIATNIKELLLDLFYGIARKDVDVVLRNLIALGIVAPTSGGDTLSVKRALAFFVDNIGRQAEQQETVAAIGEDLFAIALDSPFRFPATFTFVLRAFATLEGIGKTLDPDFSFAVTAAPFAQELLDLQDARSQQTFLLEQFQAQATEVGQATAAMPRRIQRIENVIGQLEAGDLKLRVRDLEGERANRKSSVLQLTTVNSIASMGLLNVGVQLGLAGKETAAGIVMVLAGGLAVSVALGMRRVKRLEKFENGLKGRGKFPSN